MNVKLELKFEAPIDKGARFEFEAYLTRANYPFKTKNRRGGVVEYTIQVEEPVEALYIGCNLTAYSHGLFQSSVTK